MQRIQMMQLANSLPEHVRAMPESERRVILSQMFHRRMQALQQPPPQPIPSQQPHSQAFNNRQQQQQAGMMMNTEQTGMNQFIPGVQANNAINGFLNAGQMSGMGNNILMQQAMQQQQQQSMMGMNAGGPGGMNIGAAGGGNGVSQEMLQSSMQRNEGGAAPQGQAHG